MNPSSPDFFTICFRKTFVRSATTRLRALLLLTLCGLSGAFAMTWSGDPGPWGAAPMNDCVQTWNTYSNYNYNIPVVYGSGTPTADAGYMGQIRFGGSGNYRTAMHESSHWMGTGTTGQWDLHQRYSIWNGTYTTSLRRAYDGPGERQFIYGVHYGPQGANYDSEGVQGPQMVGIIGAFRRDQDLSGGDQTIGIASGTYLLRNRVTTQMLDSLGTVTEGVQVKQNLNGQGTAQQWNVSLILGTTYFTLQNVATGKYLDSLASTTDGSPVALTSLAGGTPTDAQLWQIQQTDSFFFKIVNKANGKGLDNLGATAIGTGLGQWNAANNFNWNQQWTFMHALAQTAPAPNVVSQGRPVASSSTQDNHYDLKGNNGVEGDRWTASSGSYPQWWRVDTGIVQPITKVAIDWFPTGAPTFQYKIEVSDNDANWTVAADRTANTVAGTTVDNLTGSGRFVRVTVTGGTAGYYAAFMECRVYNEATPMQQLSQFCPVAASSEQTGNLAVNANDVDPVFTRWCANSPGYPAWWMVDLGSVRPVNKAIISWFDDDGRSYQYKVEGSTDGVNFTTLADHTNNTQPYTTSDVFSGNARWVRINVTGGSSTYPSIYDAQIFGATGPQAPPAPTVTATAVSNQIQLSWAAVDGATSYTVKRSTVNGGPYLTLGTQSGTTFSDSNIVAGVSYYYVVSASNNYGEGGNSSQAIVATQSDLQVCLPFDESAGVIAPDISGYGRNGTLINGPLWVAGNVGNAVDLDGTDDYVALPAGVAAGLTNFTVAAWVNPDSLASWARIFDFGTGSDNYMFLAATNGTALRFAIRTPAVGEQTLSAAPLPAGVWSHVAVTLSGNNATLYVNGVAVASNNAMTLTPSSLGATTNNWIGRSQFADPYFNGKVDDFRIYNRALGVAEIGRLRGVSAPAAAPTLAAQAGDARVALAWSPVLGATGYKVKRSIVAGGPYSLFATVNAAGYINTGLSNGISYFYVVSAVNAAGETADSAEAGATPLAQPPAAPAILSPDEIGTQVRLIWSPSAGATSYNIKRSTTSGGPYITLTNTSATSYTDSAVVSNNSYYYVVSAVGASGESGNSPQASALPSASSDVYLKMDEASGTTTADDTGNGWTGTLVNGPTRVAGRIDRAISFDGTDDYATLPSGVTGSVNDCTISVWVKATALGNWTRVFDFGTGTTNYMFLTLKSSTGNPRFAIRTPGVAEEIIDSSTAFSLNTWNHIAVTISGNTGTLYLNGAVVGVNYSMSLKPSTLGGTIQNYLAKSQYPDPYFSGQLDEFQIRTRALAATEIAALASPAAAPTGLAATSGTQQVSLAWNSAVGATGYTVRRSTVSGGPYLPIVSNLTSPGYVDTGLTGGTTYFYVVTAQKLLADSPLSAQVSATPVNSLTPAQTWRQTWFGTTGNAGNAADSADPDNDGVSNLLERALGGNPTVPDTSILPAVDPAAPLLSIIFTRAKGFSDLTLMVQESSDEALGVWTSATGTETVTDLGATERVRFTVSPGNGGHKFLRLHAVQVP